MDPGFKLVEAREILKDVLLHTQDSQATIGVIEDLLVNDVRGLTCLVHLSHKDASPTEFAALARPSYKRNDDPAFSNWLRVEPLGWDR